MAGSMQRQNVYVQVTELCLLAKGLRTNSIPPDNPRNGRQINPRFTPRCRRPPPCWRTTSPRPPPNAAAAGFTPAQVDKLGGHSLRAGFVTEAFRQGADAHACRWSR